MILADVNVLVNAFRTDAPQHALCRGWLRRSLREKTAFGVSPLVLSSVIRVATNRHIYNPPSKAAGAIDFCNYLLAEPGVHVVRPGIRHWDIFTELCRLEGVSGNLVTDAWLAALAIEHGCEWITLDRDFARFKGLRWRAPD